MSDEVLNWIKKTNEDYKNDSFKEIEAAFTAEEIEMIIHAYKSFH